MRLKFEQKIRLFYTGIAVILLFLGVTCFQMARKSSLDNDRVNHTYDVLQKLADIRTNTRNYMMMAESYIIEGALAHIGSTDKRRQNLAGGLDELAALVADNTDQKQRVDDLKGIVGECMTFVDRLSFQGAGKEKSEAKLEFIEDGNELIERLIMQVMLIENEEKHILDIRKKKFDGSQRYFLFAIVSVIVTTFILLVSTYIITRTQMRYSKNINDRIKHLNKNLDKTVREQTEEMLQQSSKLQYIMDNMNEGLQIISRDFRYVYLNNAVIHQSKYTRDELLGKTMMEMYPGIENTELFTKIKKSIHEGCTVKFENEFVYPDNTVAYFELSIEPTPEGVLILSTDVTDRVNVKLERERRINDTQRILYKISHEVRQPVTSLLGITELLNNAIVTEKEIKTVSDHIGESAMRLDMHTRELSKYIAELSLVK